MVFSDRKKLWWRRLRHQSDVCQSDVISGDEAERGLVEFDLTITTDLIGDLLPRSRDCIGTRLCRGAARIDLGELVFRDTVILEDAGNTRLDRRAGMMVGLGFRFQIGRDEGLVIARSNPFRNVEMAVAVGLEARGVGGRPQREILTAQMRRGTPRRLLLDRIA